MRPLFLLKLFDLALMVQELILELPDSLTLLRGDLRGNSPWCLAGEESGVHPFKETTLVNSA